jgi:predicted lipoprotein with Yx(FWY)xxD motif/plastocyanin
MKRLVLLFAACFALATSGLAVAHPTPDTSGIMVGETDELGPFLTDAAGNTLYLFTKDEPGKSNCYDDCVAKWPVFYADEGVTLPEGAAGELGEITRDDGTEQTTYNGWPLYYWINDEAPGDTTGQGVGDVWFVVEVSDTTTPVAEMASPEASPAASPAAEAESAVTIQDFAFGPQTLEITAGTTVTFTNNDSAAHTATADDGSWDTGTIDAGASATITFDTPGTYTYKCAFHPNMTGTIVVS